MNRLAGPALCLALAISAGCSGDGAGERVELKPKRHELVDNLIVVERRGGNTGLLGLTGGRILLRGRCLIVETGGKSATPVFGTEVAVLPRALRLGGRQFEWGDEITFRASGTPMPLPALEGGKCPAQGISVRGVQ